MGSFYTALFYHSRWYKILIAQRLRLCATWAQCMSGVASILFAEIWKKISGVNILLTSLSVATRFFWKKMTGASPASGVFEKNSCPLRAMMICRNSKVVRFRVFDSEINYFSNVYPKFIKNCIRFLDSKFYADFK